MQCRGDLNGDLYINLEYLSVLIGQQLEHTILNPMTDFSGDSITNFVEFAIFMEKQ